MERVINISLLTLEDIESMNVQDAIKIESNGKIVNDSWEDIPRGLSRIFGNSIYGLWEHSFYKCFELVLGDKKFNLFHGNTKWFSLTRIS